MKTEQDWQLDIENFAKSNRQKIDLIGEDVKINNADNIQIKKTLEKINANQVFIKKELMSLNDVKPFILFAQMTKKMFIGASIFFTAVLAFLLTIKELLRFKVGH